MQRLQPRQLIIPSILFSATLLFAISRSVYGFSMKNDHPSNIVNISKTKQSIQHPEISSKYPQSIQHWGDEIIKAAHEHDLDPNLISAVMLQESGGQPDVISSSGAVGLMQIMPRDGVAAFFTCINGPCFQNRPSIDDLKDPKFNIEFGTRMLAGLIHSKGSLRVALKAYGPMDTGYYYADKVLSIFDLYE